MFDAGATRESRSARAEFQRLYSAGRMGEPSKWIVNINEHRRDLAVGPYSYCTAQAERAVVIWVGRSDYNGNEPSAN